MPGGVAEAIAVVLLALSLGSAVLRPRGISEAVVAVPAAALIVLLGVVPWRDALHSLPDIGPTVGFLAAILVFGHLCADAGVFGYLGALAARASGGEPRRLLGLVVGLAAVITATLTLDATVVLLTPVVLTTSAALGVTARPHAYACARLANSGSLLLPVSNLTNLLAFSASGLSFERFTALMLLPWLLVVGAEWGALRIFFRRDLVIPDAADGGARSAALATGEQSRTCSPRVSAALATGEQSRTCSPRVSAARPPTYALTVLGATVTLFVVTSAVDVSPAFAALAGCVALLVPRAAGRDVHPLRLVTAASPGFCAFVLALSVIVEGVTRHGLRDVLAHLVPAGTSFWALLALAALAAVLANLVNNLPATLALLPVVSANPSWVLAVLVGANIGPNATYPGSLATLLWRRLLPAQAKPDAREFHILGLLTVPLLLVLATGALWSGAQVIGF